MISAIIVDDVPQSRDVVREIVNQHCRNVEIVGDADDVETTYTLVTNESPDLLFLDIELPDGTAFDLLERFSEPNFEVIFITGYDHFAVRAFRVSAVDFLVKPVSAMGIKVAVGKLMERLAAKQFGLNLKNFLSNMQISNPALHKIAIPTSEGLEFLALDKVIRCEANSNYTQFFLENGTRRMVARTLRDYEEILTPHGFCRVHHAHLINVNKVVRYVRGKGGYVALEDGSTVNVSSRRKEHFLSMMKH